MHVRRSDPNKPLASAVVTALLLVAVGSSDFAEPEAPPYGVYLWYSGGSAPSDEACRALVEKVRPSRAKAEDWLWGRVPEGDDRAVEYYLFLSADRMEPTFAAEGDYDFGAVRYGPTQEGITPFELVPDDHPETTIAGKIVARLGSQILSVTMTGVPLDAGVTDRTTYYCRFEEGGVET